MSGRQGQGTQTGILLRSWLIEWVGEGAERGGEEWRNNRQPKKAEEEAARKEAEQATRGKSLAPKLRKRDIGQKLYDNFERFERCILENGDGRRRRDEWLVLANSEAIQKQRMHKQI